LSPANGFPRFYQKHQDDLDNATCPPYLVEADGTVYLCQAALGTNGNQEDPADINFRIKETRGELVDFKYKLCCLERTGGGRDYFNFELEELRFSVEKTGMGPMRHMNIRFKNGGQPVERDQVFAEITFRVSR
jgi:hypothetical protein